MQIAEYGVYRPDADLKVWEGRDYHPQLLPCRANVTESIDPVGKVGKELMVVHQTKPCGGHAYIREADGDLQVVCDRCNAVMPSEGGTLNYLLERWNVQQRRDFNTGRPVAQQMPVTQVVAHNRIKVARLPQGMIPEKYFEALYQNQQIALCCRHPEEHDVVALKSHPREPRADIYIFVCTCGRQHPRFVVGMGDERPEWSVE